MMTQYKRIAIQGIKKKLVGHEIGYDEAYAIMHEFTSGGLDDIFVAYFAAASFKSGFTNDELYNLTKAMVETGSRFSFKGIVADKHSIGGMPGTRTTLVVVPIIASAGYLIPKTSSRAITTPAGTADCMEVLSPVDLNIKQAERVISSQGGCIIWGGHLGIAPADDVIIRVQSPIGFESFDKIIISILAKKVAAGATHMVLDLPVGPTMKIKYVKDALSFKEKFVNIAQRFGIVVRADINFQQQPAGQGIGPVYEAIDALKVLSQADDRPIDLEHKSLKLASELLDLCFKADNRKDDPLIVAEQILKSGKAIEKFRSIVEDQGGDGGFVISKIKKGRYTFELKSKYKGKVIGINNYNITSIARILGAPQDKKAGFILHKRFNDKIEKNDILLTMYSQNKSKLFEAKESLRRISIYEIEVF